MRYQRLDTGRVLWDIMNRALERRGKTIYALPVTAVGIASMYLFLLLSSLM